MSRWFNCASEKVARRILREGFGTGRISAEYADYYSRFLSEMLNGRDLDRVNDAYDRSDTAGARELAAIWNRRFSAGTLIWLTKQPDTQYGQVCFEVTLPRGARKIGGDRDMGWVFYAPAPIGPKHFQVVEVEDD